MILAAEWAVSGVGSQSNEEMEDCGGEAERRERCRDAQKQEGLGLGDWRRLSGELSSGLCCVRLCSAKQVLPPALFSLTVETAQHKSRR